MLHPDPLWDPPAYQMNTGVGVKSLGHYGNHSLPVSNRIFSLQDQGSFIVGYCVKPLPFLHHIFTAI